jgi:hypothetical protein
MPGSRSKRKGSVIDLSPQEHAKPPEVLDINEAVRDYGELQARLIQVLDQRDPELIASITDAMRGMLVQALFQRNALLDYIERQEGALTSHANSTSASTAAQKDTPDVD